MLAQRARSAVLAGVAIAALVGALAVVPEGPTASASTSVSSAARILFSEGTGAVAHDSSGNGRDAALSSAAGWSSGPATASKSLSLTGTIGSDASVAAATLDSTRDFTIGAWVAPTDVNRLQTIATIDGTQVGSVYLQVTGGHARVAMFATDSTSGTLTIVDSAMTLPAGVFSQVTATYNALTKNVFLYVNGASAGSAAVPATFRATGVTGIGRGIYGGQRVDAFGGRIADLRLSQTYSSQQRVAESTAVDEVRFGEGTGSSATDVSGYGQTQTLAGDATWMIGKQYPTAVALSGNVTSFSSGAQNVNTAGSYTVSAWVYVNDPARQQTAVAINGQTQSAFYLQVVGGAFCLCAFGSDSTSATLYAARSATISAATWYQVTGVIDATAHQMSLYVNGTLAQQAALPTQWSANGPLVVGHGQYGGSAVDPWNGGVEDVRLYPVALPANTTSALASPAFNACNDPNLPVELGTTYAYPSDPYGFGYANTTQLGWTGNQYAPLSYLSGSFWARGVPDQFANGNQTICGSLYSFGVYMWGLNGAAPAGGSVNWTMASGYLPAFTTAFTRNGVAVSITNFSDKSTISGTPTELVHSRVIIANNSGSTQTIDPAPSQGLLVQTSASTTIPTGTTRTFDYVVGVDTFGTSLPIPGAADILAQAPSYNSAFTAMSSYWNGQVGTLPTLTLPNVTLPNTGLANPGTAMANAFKAALVYTKMIQVGAAPYSAQNNYNAVLEHDAPTILTNAFVQGDLADAQQKLLQARQASGQNYDSHGANQYFDGQWKTPLAWANYLARTSDTAFVSKWFHDDTTVPSNFGPSLYAQMHTLVSMLNAQGYLPASNDNDSVGTWLFDDYAGMIGLASYRYIATQIGNSTEASWASQQLTALQNNTNSALQKNQTANGFSYLPCEVQNPNSSNRCNAATDANWASTLWYGQNAWDLLLAGGAPSGLIGDPTQTDKTYDYGFGRTTAAGLPFPTMGGFPGYTTAYNTAYSLGALYGTRYRSLPITSYAWQIQNATGGPNSFWESSSDAGSANNPWAGMHPTPQFGASPYAFPLAGQMLGLSQSIVAEGQSVSGTTTTRPLYIGRGVPDAWIANGQNVSAANLLSSVATGPRTTYGVSMSTTLVNGVRQVTVSLTGTLPSGARYVQLPVFTSAGVGSVTGGSYDTASATVTFAANSTQVVVTLNS